MFPYSGVFPELKDEFRQGFLLGLGGAAAAGSAAATPVAAAPTVLAEFIQNGDLKTTEQALQKLFFYERVDVVAGIVGNCVLHDLLPTLERAQAPLIVHNLGGHFPGRYLSSPYLFYNSLHLWKSEWAMGKWAQARYGGVPAVSLSLYEAGYHFLESFKNGAGASGAETLTLNVMRREDGPADPLPLVRFLEEQQPPYSHVLVSGPEAERFLSYYDASPIRDSVPLTSHPFLGAEHIPFASTWIASLDTPGNRAFVSAYLSAHGAEPSVFAMLGYESGLALSGLNASGPRLSRTQIVAHLSTASPIGPRGPIRLSSQPVTAPQPVYLCRGTAVLERLDDTSTEDPAFAHLQEVATGWANPYLCV
ncbi:MAG TPA: ABC transporter substrate-binding protein [Dinghuibacter sp.]|uniref:ABC transporter substrate-binding protein n=1 Tax=Dinghuibacter sp. TaxID=2024697 RepID=UPI002C6ADF41|nr:ABC transporter substrate-binding protein [Dinghuibacter sp.]HTJ10861.1 ABC transporter substrate-binding protein [Dinghuibacter sp.]